MVEPPVPPSAQEEGAGSFWRFDDAMVEHPAETFQAWKNQPNGTSYGGGKGVEGLPDPCIFQFQPKHRKRGLPDLWSHGALYVASTRLLHLLLSLDADAIAHRPVVMMNEAQEVFDTDHHLFDVTRVLDVVDYANSVIAYRGGGTLPNGTSYGPYVARYHSVRLIKDIDASFKLFRHRDSRIIATSDVKDVVEAARPKVRNVDFAPIRLGI